MSQRPARPKKGRTIQLLRRPDDQGPGLFLVSEGTKSCHYVFREIPSEIGGRGFILHRLGLGTLYHVRIGEARDCSCECMGFLAHGKCKHVLGLIALAGHDLI